MNTIRVGLYDGSTGRGTGPDTYCRSIRAASLPGVSFAEVSPDSSPEADLIHVTDAKRVPLSSLESWRAPVILDFHDDYWTKFRAFPSPDAPIRWIRQKQLYGRHLTSISKAAAIVVHSESVRQSIETFLDETKRSRSNPGPITRVVRYGVQAPDFEGPRSEDAGERLILLVGRDVFRKGFQTMARAMRIVVSRQPSSKLVVIGDEYPHSRIAAHVLAAGLPATFLPAAPASEIIRWYKRASVLALPSRLEAFGIVLIEAMAAGTPVVASRVGGIPEAVEDEVSGLLHEPGNHRDLADKIVRTLEDEELRSRLVRGGRERARLFSIENMAADLARAYKETMETI